MIETNHKYDVLSTREGFNTSLRHFNLVMEIISAFEEDQENLADFINELSSNKEIKQDQIKPVIHALLYDKYQYSYASYNFKENITDLKHLNEEVQKWNAVDIVLVYYHPELGITAINPKNLDSLEAIQSFKKNELVTIFAGEFDKTEAGKKIYSDAVEKLINLFEGKKVKTPESLTKGKFKYTPPKKEAPKPPKKVTAPKAAATKSAPAEEAPPPPVSHVEVPSAAAAGKKKMTPMYGITVTNELFHNGNVEAWKKIITSYEHYNPGLEVLVFYDGEKINDINTLFKWGKVKRGTAIMISVVGENIKDVAKLKRYLMQGASNRFEAFLQGSPNKILKLF